MRAGRGRLLVDVRYRPPSGVGERLFELDARWESTEAHVSASGDMAYDIGTVTINTPEGPIPAKYVVIWVRQDGEWKVAVDMFSNNQ